MLGLLFFSVDVSSVVESGRYIVLVWSIVKTRRPLSLSVPNCVSLCLSLSLLQPVYLCSVVSGCAMFSFVSCCVLFLCVCVCVTLPLRQYFSPAWVPKSGCPKIGATGLLGASLGTWPMVPRELGLRRPYGMMPMYHPP